LAARQERSLICVKDCPSFALGRLTAPRDAKRGTELVASGIARARALVGADPINLEWKDTLVQGLLARADIAKLAADAATRKSSLEEALATARVRASRCCPQGESWSPCGVQSLEMRLWRPLASKTRRRKSFVLPQTAQRHQERFPNRRQAKKSKRAFSHWRNHSL